MKKNKTKTEIHTEKKNQRKNDKNKKEELMKKEEAYYIKTKENLLKRMKVMGRLEPATFRFVGEHVIH